jgi:hypothetical protein
MSDTVLDLRDLRVEFPTRRGCLTALDGGHDAVPHGGHVCYLVNGRLHYPHDGHCDDHRPLRVV